MKNVNAKYLILTALLLQLWSNGHAISIGKNDMLIKISNLNIELSLPFKNNLEKDAYHTTSSFLGITNCSKNIFNGASINKSEGCLKFKTKLEKENPYLVPMFLLSKNNYISKLTKLYSKSGTTLRKNDEYTYSWGTVSHFMTNTRGSSSYYIFDNKNLKQSIVLGPIAGAALWFDKESLSKLKWK